MHDFFFNLIWLNEEIKMSIKSMQLLLSKKEIFSRYYKNLFHNAEMLAPRNKDTDRPKKIIF